MRTIAICSLLIVLAACSQRDSMYPVDEGRSWEYQVSMLPSMASERGQRVILSNLPERELNGQRVTPQSIEKAQQVQFIFVSSDNTGVYEYARQPAGAAEPEILPTPIYYLKYPFEEGASWNESKDITLLIGRPWIPTTTIIEALDETTTVPAGTFGGCIKTRSTGQVAHDLGFRERILFTLEDQAWYCPSIGMVKSIRKESNELGDGGQISMELVQVMR